MLARSPPTCPTFVLGSSSGPERARPVDLARVYSSALFSRNLNDCSYIRFTKHTDDCHDTQRRTLTRLWVRAARLEPTGSPSLHHRFRASLELTQDTAAWSTGEGEAGTTPVPIRTRSPAVALVGSATFAVAGRFGAYQDQSDQRAKDGQRSAGMKRRPEALD